MSAMPKTQAPEPPPETVEERFRRLATVWRNETAHFSSPRKYNEHPAYQEIIGMGWDVVPFLLAEIASTREFWFHALKCITGESPVLPEARGKLDQVAAAWLQWGREHGYSC